MKIVKKALFGLGILLVLLVAAAVVLPIIFKDDIKSAIDKAIAKNVNADVVFDVNNFSLTVFRNFPNITAEIKELGVFNRAPFEGEHLFVVERMDVEINLKDVLFGDQIRLKGITLVNPQINVKVLPDGRANYDITYPSADTTSATQEPSKFSFGIDHWEVMGGNLVYDDKSIPYFLSLKGLHHTGSGDFTQDVFDLKTHTIADTVDTSMGNMQFLNHKRAELDAVISISEDISKFTFKENKARINDFDMSFDGWFKMNPDNYGMDISFKSPQNSFKSLLSLVPGMYTKDFGKVETKGDLSFAGFVKGTYSEKQMPAFNVNLKVNDAMFKYPDLPTPVSNINMDLLIDNKDGVMNNTVVDLKRLHLDLGSNPVDARMRIENLRNYPMDGSMRATLNMADITKMVPMPGVEMKGMVSVKASVKGVYDSLKKILPAVEGSMSMNDFRYVTKDLPSVTISKAAASLDPKKVELSAMTGMLGKSDFDVTGTFSNYIGYAMKNEVLKGTMKYNSKLLDLNEFMTDSGKPAATADTASLSVIPIPKNIDFTMQSAVGTVKMMDYTLTNASGAVILKDGLANLSGLKFNMLGGAFAMNGTYNPTDIKHPKYDFDLKIQGLSIQQAASSFSMVKTYAPVAGLVNGNFSTDFKINGELTSKMMPNLATVNGAGLIKIAEAAMTQSKLVAGISSLTNLSNTDQVTLKDVLMTASIANGRLSVKPFDVKFGSYATTISGSTGLDQSIDYSIKMMVPAGQMGAQLQGLVNQYSGTTKPTDKIPVTIGLGGTFKDPKTKIIGTEQKEQVKEAVTKAAEQKGQEAVQQLTEGAKPEDVVKNILGGTKPPADTTKKKKDSTDKAADPLNSLLKNKVNSLLKKKND